VEEADVSLLYQIGQAADRCPRVWLVKDEIVAVLVHSLGELGPVERGGAAATPTLPASRARDGRRVRGPRVGARWGPLRLPGDDVRSESRFLPLFDAHLTALLFPKLTSHAPAPAVQSQDGHRREPDRAASRRASALPLGSQTRSASGLLASKKLNAYSGRVGTAARGWTPA